MKKELFNLEKKILFCNKCPRLRSVTPYPMPHIIYNREIKEKLFCIGRNPGLEHDYTNVYFDDFMSIYHKRWWICRLGRYLRRCFGDYFVMNYIFFTNVCKCSSPNNSELKREEMLNCFPFLEEQIEIIKPIAILVFGKTISDFLNKNLKVDVPVFNLYHPSYFMRDKNDKKEREQYKKILRIKKFFVKRLLS